MKLSKIAIVLVLALAIVSIATPGCAWFGPLGGCGFGLPLGLGTFGTGFGTSFQSSVVAQSSFSTTGVAGFGCSPLGFGGCGLGFGGLWGPWGFC